MRSRLATHPQKSEQRLPRAFFARGCLAVAPDIVGTRLIHDAGGCRYVGLIVEVEAYLGVGSDPGSHGHRGLTRRNQAMFGPPGHLYVYRSYGVHTCLNFVTEPEGRCAAILVRAVEPLEGFEQMQCNRPGRGVAELTNGPGKLTRAMAITLSHDGLSMQTGPIFLLGRDGSSPRVGVSERIGLSRGKELPYRFFDLDSAFVSHARRALRVLRP